MANLMLYQRLLGFLQQQLPIRYRKNLLAWIESGTLIDQGKNVTDEGVEIAHIRYKATFLFNELPFNQLSVAEIMANIQVWLNENDELRYQLDFAEIGFDVEIYDDSTADLTFDIEFQEPITAIKSERGKLNIDGVNYQINSIPIYIAEEVEVIDD
ncbi:P2 phage tail completion protein R [Gallibacterium anatis UMN179]|uniref:p2 phage tail completion protein R n=1 Tax=Gallibacterium anatis (strain UMN179) TaxID=1005058 RepID=F4HA09_GALAU|nr:phage tail protein [Gallibacterium anatis]AEC18496.1 P2 phage tail completion protein R [Gallibacterium anatis UMN179]